MANYRSLDADKVIETIERLCRRIDERFPDSGLSGVAAELLAVARDHANRVRAIRRPDPLLRGAIGLFLLGGAALLAFALVTLKTGSLDWRLRSGADLIQVSESALGILVFGGAAIAFLFTLELRVKRSRALHAIHELRSLAHIVDMHQLTKDPERSLGIGADTPSSPRRQLDPFQLNRYLDYCSELLALISKLGALYAQSLDEQQAQTAVDEIEALTTGLSRKIWQKIMLLERLEKKAGA